MFAVLKQFSTTVFLQVLTLLASRERREAAIKRGRSEERAPVSCKRRDVLRLTLEDYRHYSDQVMKNIPVLVRFLHGERIFTADHLPYNTQLVPLTAIMTVLGDQADTNGKLS